MKATNFLSRYALPFPYKCSLSIVADKIVFNLNFTITSKSTVLDTSKTPVQTESTNLYFVKLTCSLSVIQTPSE